MTGRTNHEIAKDALEYYVKRLEELKNDEEILVGKPMISEDIDSNTKLSLKAIKGLKIQSDNVFKDYVKTICSALVVYLKALEQSKNKIEEKLEREIHLQWDKMNEEIESVKDLQRSIGCKEH